jgi:TPR repeat protein
VRIIQPAIRTAALLLTLAALLSATASPQDARGFPSQRSSTSTAPNRRYYALVIGIDKYPESMPQLKTATSDARSVADVLQRRYSFQVQLLLDAGATRKGILSAIAAYRNLLTANDNLLIYYAGHGFLDKDEGVAYWLPRGAVAGDDQSNWVSADDVNHAIRALSAGHILVVSDSCYSGGLAQPGQRLVIAQKPTVEQQAYLDKMRQRRSRNLMASGGNEPVADSGTAGHSVFAYPLLDGLEHPDQTTFTAQHLFDQSIRVRVGGNASQTPLHTSITNSGDDGGDFVFVRTNLTPAELTAPNPANAATGPSAKQRKAAEDYNRGVLMAGTNRYSEAVPILTSSCDAGSAKSCVFLGFLYAKANGVAKDEAKAAKLFGRACDGGEAIGCTRLGVMYSLGTGVEEDFAKAATLYRQGCDAGDARGCSNLGQIYVVGKFESAHPGEIFRAPCEGGREFGCIFMMGDEVGPHKAGGFEKDDAQAAVLYRKACDGGDAPGCGNLGHMYEQGIGVAKDVTLAIANYRKACDGGDARTCDYLGDIFYDGELVPGDDAQALTLHGKACDAGIAHGCYQLGFTYDNGIGIPKDEPRAAEAYRRACNGGESSGCTRLGTRYEKGTGVLKDESQSADFSQKACEGGDPSGCNNLGEMYEVGAFVPKDLARAVVFYRKGCERGDAIGCRNLGSHYEQGAGTPADKTKALEAYKLGCNREDQPSCNALKRLQP